MSIGVGQEVWERVPNKELLGGMEKHGQQGYRTGIVIDALFDQGTVVMGIQAVVGENGELIELLQASCPSLSLGYSRSRDINGRSEAEQALKLAYDELEERVVERTTELEREVAKRLAAEYALKVSLQEKEL